MISEMLNLHTASYQGMCIVVNKIKTFITNKSMIYRTTALRAIRPYLPVHKKNIERFRKYTTRLRKKRRYL